MNDARKNPETLIALFQRKEVRRAIHDNEWWFVITDVVAVLTNSANPSGGTSALWPDRSGWWRSWSRRYR
jgi:prophage antirepressor-like protein